MVSVLVANSGGVRFTRWIIIAMSFKLSVVIPAYNEAGSIEATVERVFAVSRAQHWDVEVIVVDDGSQDTTADLALKAGARIIRHPANGGYGLSLQHGIAFAQSEIVAITDADGTYPVEELPALQRMVVDRGFDMAVGARTGEEYRRGWWKYPARILFRWLVEYVSGRTIPDVNSGLRVFKKSAILPYLPYTCLGFSFTTSITTIFFLNGLFIGYHPVAYAKRVGSSKVRHFRDTLRTAQILVSVISRYNPIKLFLLVAVLNASLGIFALLFGFFLSFELLGWFGVLLMILSPIIFCFGPLAESLRREV